MSNTNTHSHIYYKAMNSNDNIDGIYTLCNRYRSITGGI